MAFVIAIVDCSWKELLRKAVKTEAGWTFSALYAFLSLGSEYELLDVRISSDGNTEWSTVELEQPTEHCVIFRKLHVLFRASTREEPINLAY